jgi:hypothetical protein
MTTFSISELCASYGGEGGFFARFQGLARQLDGVQDVVVVASEECPVRAGSFVSARVSALVSAPVKHFEEVVGELHLVYDPRSFENRSASALAGFLAGQLGFALQGAAIQRSNVILQNELEELLAGIQEHKLLEKARGVIESRPLIPAGEGQRLLRKVSAQSGRNLRDLAQGIVSSANRNPWKFRREFWA